VDAVVADFIAGAARADHDSRRERQRHRAGRRPGQPDYPGYSGVTLGLLHGSCPDALILCHQVTRDYIGDYHGREPWVKIPSYTEMIEIYERAAHPVASDEGHRDLPQHVRHGRERARAGCRKSGRGDGLPATDPVRFDSDLLVDAIIGARATI